MEFGPERKAHPTPTKLTSDDLDYYSNLICESRKSKYPSRHINIILNLAHHQGVESNRSGPTLGGGWRQFSAIGGILHDLSGRF